MRTVQGTLEDKGLKNMDLLPHRATEIEGFDATESVMNRIYKKHSARLLSARWSMRSGRRAAPAMLALLLVLGASVTAYGASRYLEFKNSRGEVILNTAQAGGPDSSAEAYTSLLEGYSEQVRAQLEPGELAAYYIKDDAVNSKDPSNPVKVEYKPAEFTAFGELQQEIGRTQAPSLSAAERLPAGYQFDYGYVYPADPFSGLNGRADYEAQADNLAAQAEAAPADQKLFISKLDWSTAEFTLIRYAKGSDYVTVTARALSPDAALTTIFQDEQASAEKLTIKGTEAFYITGGSNQEFYPREHWLGWKDESSHLLYEIYDNPGSQLTKQELVELAEDVLGKQ